MKLLELHVERLPGLRGGLHLRREHLAAPFVVIHGPNGCGKSSLVRALRALLWEEAVVEPLEASARLERGGTEWVVQHRDGRTRWERNGQPADRPRLPAVSAAGHMLVGLAELREAEQGHDIAEALRRELSGGYDVNAAREALRKRYPFEFRRRRAEAETLAKTEMELRRLESEQEQTLAGEVELPALEVALNEAERAGEEAARLERALQRLEAADALGQAQARLAQFPPWFEALRGDEPEQRERLDARAAQAREALVAAEDALRQARDDAAAARLGAPLPAEFCEGVEQRVTEWRTREQQIDELQRRLADVRGRLEEARRAAGGTILESGAPQLRFETFGEVEALVRAGIGLHGRREDLIRQRRHLAADEADAAPGSRSDAGGTTGLPPGLPFAAAIALLFGALAFAFAGNQLVALLVVPALAVLWWLFREAASRRAATNPAAARAQLDRQRSRLDADERALQQDEERHAQTLAALRQAHDVPAELTDVGLVDWFRLRETLRDLRLEESGIAAALADGQGAARRVRDLVAEALDGLAEAPADAAAATAAVNDLQRRSEALRRALDAAGKAEAAVERARRDRDGVAGEQREFWNRLQLSPDPEGERALHDGIVRLDDYRRASEAVREARAALAVLGEPEASFASLDRAALLARRRDCLERAAEAEAVRERRADIRSKVERARGSEELPAARAERDRARAALADVLETACTGALVELLLEQAGSEHEQEAEPRLLAVAREHFSRFTLGRWKLEALRGDAGAVALVARETGDAATSRPLRELSDGTRAQLLLAARLAYLGEIEEGEPLPFVLDDALATSDPERTAAIGTALRETARAGRQILVLTADPADVERLAGDDGGSSIAGVDLGRLRGEGQRVSPRGHLRLPAPSVVPAPDGLSPEAWAEALRVPPPDPLRPVDDLHPWWVGQHDPAALHRTLSRSIASVGQLRRLQEESALPPELHGFAVALRPWIDMAGAVLAARCVGRGRPLDREALRAAGVTAVFLDRIAAMAADLGGDARALLARIRSREDERSRRYHESALEENRAWFIENGYLDEDEPLSREAGWERVLVALATAGHDPDQLPDLRARFEQLWRAAGPRQAVAVAEEEEVS